MSQISQVNIADCEFFFICNYNFLKIACSDYQQRKNAKDFVIQCENAFHSVHEIFVYKNEIFLFLEQIDIEPDYITIPDCLSSVKLFNFYKVKTILTKKYTVQKLTSVQKQM